MPPQQGSFNPLEGPGDYDVTKNVYEDTYPAIDPAKADFSGRAVMVVGGSRGIGKEIALSFARAGASQLAVGARSIPDSLASEVSAAAESTGKKPPEFLPVSLDVASRESVEAAASTVEKSFGRLDVLVHVAGIIGEIGKIADTDPDKWWKTWNVNVCGPYLSYRSFIPLLQKTEGGLKNVCLVASVGAFVSSPGFSAYQSSKMANVRFSDFAAAEYGPEGFTCFCVHPGNIMTDIFGPSGPRKELRHIFIEKPRLPADTIVYLMREKRDWLNGRYINCTWDMTELEAQAEEIVKNNKLKVTLKY